MSEFDQHRYDDGTLTPNNTPWPNSPTNTPQLAPLLTGEQIMFSTVREGANIGSPIGNTHFTPQGPINDLMKLRAQYPFLEILPLPHSSVTVYITGPTDQKEITVPSGAMLMLVESNVGNSHPLMSISGRAAVASADNTDPALGDSVNATFVVPRGKLLYCGGLRTFSVTSSGASTMISVLFYFPQEYPTAK